MFNEMYQSESVIRNHYNNINDWLDQMTSKVILEKNAEAETHFRNIGITFSTNNETTRERIIPFDLIPRIFTYTEWLRLERGVIQRAKALNAFLADIYNQGEIIKANIIPKEIIYKKKSFEPSMFGFSPPRDIYSPIIGIDLVRTRPNYYFVLEDNCRTPSGVS